MTQAEKESFIRFNSLLGEIKDIDASIEQVKVCGNVGLGHVETNRADERRERREHVSGRRRRESAVHSVCGS